MKAMGKLEEIYNKPNVSEIIVDHFDDVYWEEDGKIRLVWKKWESKWKDIDAAQLSYFSSIFSNQL